MSPAFIFTKIHVSWVQATIRPIWNSSSKFGILCNTVIILRITRRYYFRAMHFNATAKRRLESRDDGDVCLSVTLVDQKHIGWKSWKLTAWTISPTPSLFVAQRPSMGSWKNFGDTKNLTKNPVELDSSPTLKSTHSAHRVVVFALAQLSCCTNNNKKQTTYKYRWLTV